MEKEENLYKSDDEEVKKEASDVPTQEKKKLETGTQVKKEQE